MIARFVKKPLDLHLAELHPRRRDAAAAESSPIRDAGRRIEPHPRRPTPTAADAASRGRRSSSLRCRRLRARPEVELPPPPLPPRTAGGRAPSAGAASAHGWRSSPLRRRRLRARLDVELPPRLAGGRAPSAATAAAFAPGTREREIAQMRPCGREKGFEREIADATNEEQKNDSLMRLSWALVHSRQPEDVNRGIGMLQASLDRPSSPTQTREKLYLLAVGHYRTGDYTRSRQLLERCLEIQPDWRQALTLQRLVEEKTRRDGMIGMAIITGAFGLVGLVAGGIIAAASSSSSSSRKK